MRYITFLWDNYFRRYLAKTVELLFTVRILNCPTVESLKGMMGMRTFLTKHKRNLAPEKQAQKKFSS